MGTGTRSRTRCTGSAPGPARMTVRTAQPGPHSQPTTQRTNQRLIHLWTGVIAILEEPQLIQGVTIVETILGDALDARLVGCRTAGSVALTTLPIFHAEHVEINYI